MVVVIEPLMGSTPNGKRRAIIIYASVFLCLSVLTAAARVYVRVRIVKAVGLDDWFFLGSFVCAMLITTAHYFCT